MNATARRYPTRTLIIYRDKKPSLLAARHVMTDSVSATDVRHHTSTPSIQYDPKRPQTPLIWFLVHLLYNSLYSIVYDESTADQSRRSLGQLRHFSESLGVSVITRAQFSAENFAKFRGPVCKIPRLAAAKLSKFRGSPRPSVCE